VEEIAIIIPYYKIDFFEATLSSLANQTNKRFTVYVGNDNSTKDPSLLLEKYANEFNFVYQKYDTNLGSISLVKQWERCIALSKNEKWIMILGDDDVLKKMSLKSFMII
jgi:glycosyltransferase involved in cell wall biosynthesis